MTQKSVKYGEQLEEAKKENEELLKKVKMEEMAEKARKREETTIAEQLHEEDKVYMYFIAICTYVDISLYSP